MASKSASHSLALLREVTERPGCAGLLGADPDASPPRWAVGRGCGPSADATSGAHDRQGVAVTREVWGHEWTGGSSNVVEVVVSGLRRKLGDRAAALQTVRGVGYRLTSLD